MVKRENRHWKCRTILQATRYGMSCIHQLLFREPQTLMTMKTVELQSPQNTVVPAQAGIETEDVNTDSLATSPCGENGKMETKTNPRFVGLLMAIFLPGSVHVMAGRWKTGIIWLFGFVALYFLDYFVSSIPVSLSFAAVITIQILIALLYVIYYVSLLVSSYHLTIPRLGYCGWFLFLLAALTFHTIGNDFLSLLVRTHICRHQMVTGWSMYPTLQPDEPNWSDKTMLSRLSYRSSDPHRGDIVVFEIVSTPLYPQPVSVCRRVVGLPGETVDICPPYILINGKKLLDPPIFAKISLSEEGYSGYVTAKEAKYEENEEIVLPITLGPDEYFVLSDNSVESLDSRHFGPIPREAIVGKVMRIVFPPWRIREL